MLTDIVQCKLAFLNKIYDRSGSLNITDTRTGCILAQQFKSSKRALYLFFLWAIHTTALHFSYRHTLLLFCVSGTGMYSCKQHMSQLLHLQSASENAKHQRPAPLIQSVLDG